MHRKKKRSSVGRLERHFCSVGERGWTFTAHRPTESSLDSRVAAGYAFRRGEKEKRQNLRISPGSYHTYKPRVRTPNTKRNDFPVRAFPTTSDYGQFVGLASELC